MGKAKLFLICYLYRDLVDLVQDVDTRDVDTVSLHYINQFLGRTVGAENNVSIVNLILPKNCLHQVYI